jgi:hypothetical protein
VSILTFIIIRMCGSFSSAPRTFEGPRRRDKLQPTL